MSSGEELLRRHIDRFNNGVRSGDFGPMLEGFTEDAEMFFGGVPAGPFRGRDAIAAAYREQPPDDEVEILGVTEQGDQVVARYRWRDPTAPAGEMRITTRGDLIARLVVTFEQPEEPD